MNVGELEAMGIIAATGGIGGFGGAFAAIKVHIHYINQHQDRQDNDIARVEAKADLAHERLDRLQGVKV